MLSKKGIQKPLKTALAHLNFYCRYVF